LSKYFIENIPINKTIGATILISFGDFGVEGSEVGERVQ
jgi:hypothetical protein